MLMALPKENTSKNGIYLPTRCIVGNTYKSLEVRGLTIGELLTLSKVSDNKAISDLDTNTIRDLLSKIFKVEDNYTIRDVYMVDIKFGLLYSLIITDSKYSFEYNITCSEFKDTDADGNEVVKGCGHKFSHKITPRDYIIDTGKVVGEAEIEGYKLAPITFGDWIDSIDMIQNNDSVYDKLRIVFASLLNMPGKTLKDKLKEIDENVPARVALEIQNNEYIQKMDIQPEFIEVECPECGEVRRFIPDFDIKALLPSL